MAKKVNGSDNRISAHKREVRRTEHEGRLVVWQSYTPKQQLDLLDAYHGEGQGASRQRARLAKLL